MSTEAIPASVLDHCAYYGLRAVDYPPFVHSVYQESGERTNFRYPVTITTEVARALASMNVTMVTLNCDATLADFAITELTQ